MKQQWLKFAARIDALTVRERVMVFLAAAGSIIFLLYAMLLTPLYARQAALHAQIRQQQNNIGGIDADILQRIELHGVDPDAASRQRLQAVKLELAQLTASLRTMQKGLVAPERIAPLLETLLRGNGKLQLVSLKTLPVSGVGAVFGTASGDSAGKVSGETGAPSKDALAAAAAKGEPIAKPAELLYRHGVEIVLQGGYLDMINYMAELEAMPAQLFWGKARLDVDEYPQARLSLTLYTLSLDPTWMKL